MGSFAGHIDEAIFFLLLGSWWMFVSYFRYIKSHWSQERYECHMSYPVTIMGKRIPLEAILKTAFPFAGFMAEIIDSKAKFLDAEGNFSGLIYLQHMTIYGLFVLHGIIDILMSVGIPLPPGLDYLSAALCFFWYGLSFSFHAHMPGKEPLEQMVHVLPVSVMYACALALALEMWHRGCFLLQLSRTFCLLLLGVWFFHVSFILYLPTPFPGSSFNPRWDHADERNVSFVVALIGFHACLVVAAMVTTYLVVWLLMRARAGDRKHFRPLLQNEDDCRELDCEL